jgi:hypothetical protein
MILLLLLDIDGESLGVVPDEIINHIDEIDLVSDISSINFDEISLSTP